MVRQSAIPADRSAAPAPAHLPGRFTGFSLLEVMVSIAILLFGVTLIMNVTTNAQRFASRCSELTEEQVLCQSILNEIQMGIREARPVTAGRFEQNPDYEFSIESEPLESLALIRVEVAVRRAFPDESISGRDRLTNRPPGTGSPREFRLARFIPRRSNSSAAPFLRTPNDGAGEGQRR